MCREATSRLSFAKLLIEVDAKKLLPDELYVFIPNEDGRDPLEVVVRVEYPWRPSWCANCLIFDHNVHGCPIMVAKWEKEMREELEVKKKGEQEREEFTVVQRKGKEKMGGQGNQNQGLYQQGGKFVSNYKKKHNSNFFYVNRGVPSGKGSYGGDMRSYRGESSGVKNVANGQNNKSILQNNKFNLLDNLEEISTRVEVVCDEKSGGSNGVVSGNKGSLNIEAKAESSGKMSKVNVKEGERNENPKVGINHSSTGGIKGSQVVNVQEQVSSRNVNEGDPSISQRIATREEMKNCELNTETEVDSDEEDTARFMVENRSLHVPQNSELESDEDRENTLDHEAFIIEQIFGGPRKGGKEDVIGWDPGQYDVMELFTTDQVIHCLVNQISSGDHFFCSVIYAENDHVIRRQLWHSLNIFSQLVGNSPWVLLGDFNAILSLTQSKGGVIGPSPVISEFKDCTMKIGVMDLHYSGVQFTWSGSPHGTGIVKKLDRALINSAFLNKHSGAKCKFLTRGTSDHSPIVVIFDVTFKFQNFVAYRNNFLDLVKSKWRDKVIGVRMFQVVQKLRNLKPVFRNAAWESDNLSSTVQGLSEELKLIQVELDNDPFNENLKTREACCLRNYSIAALEEKRFLKQQSKIHWLRVGDQNNEFFHKSLQTRKNRNRISSILNDEGRCVESQEMVDQFVSFYKNLLATEVRCDQMVGLEEWVRKVPVEKTSDLVRMVTDEEIKNAMFGIGDDKAPGPDGSFWEINVPWDAAWSWKKILWLREDFQQFIVYRPGNGMKTFFWYDTWFDGGPLSKIVSPREIASMGSNITTKLADCNVGIQWHRPRGILNKMPLLRDVNVVLQPTVRDMVRWKSRNGKEQGFKTSIV
ncbi:hypothetical protein POM88_028000 [Heracleum sosnowskyi]|uniref:Uncharacterized protein n=1 Tax=Heracleum sosnowskyi TaxID=360622 RepID=A0AAD8MQ25_9APIA|nr:hypothetical protein POM88_028000 [Heracleum sosnowskyi]